MRDLRKYWQEVNAIEKTLEASVWLAAKAGNQPLVEVPANVGAKMLHAGAHRLASEEEKDAHRASQLAERRRAFHADLRRKGIAVVSVEAKDE